MVSKKDKNILWFEELSSKDTELAGGKNASLGEMYSNLTEKGVNIPNGFALTSKAYWNFMEANGLKKKIKEIFKKYKKGNIEDLQKTSKKLRKLILDSPFPEDLEKDIRQAYQKLSKEYGQKNVSIAARSSATSEDSKEASFAGQHETFLNIRGEEEVLNASKKCVASLFLERAISYREEKGFNHMDVALSVGIQKMVRSDIASSGIMFTMDTESGFEDVVLINSIWGIGELIVQGKITPDQFYVFKPTLKEGYDSIIVKNLGRKNKKMVFGDNKENVKEIEVEKSKQLEFSITDEEVLQLAKWACKIEDHYDYPQDIEWAKDGETGKLFIVQSRPETVHAPDKEKTYKEYNLKTDKVPIVEGIAIGDKIGSGKAHIIPDVSEIADFKEGEILVTNMTDPDWVPIMRKASAIITNEGGKSCHAAIVARELGIPTIVGTENGTKILEDGQMITADCTQGLEGKVFEGKIEFDVEEYELEKIPELDTKIMVNIGAPEIAFSSSFLPQEGVGLAREEFIIAEKIRAHPLALYYYEDLKEKKEKLLEKLDISKKKAEEVVKKIEKNTVEHSDKKEFFIKELAEGVSQIAAGFYPKEVIVRFSDFKTNEYKNLIGGELFEDEESNPMLGFRGASRYLDDEFKHAFKMECKAIKRAREKFGLTNISVMVPFCRTIEEGKEVRELIEKFGLGSDDINVYVMCEIPSNVIIADQFLEIFDGMSIGTNDLTQLTLGLDRDNAKIAKVGDERDEAVKKMVAKVIQMCKEKDKYVGICGEAPSTYIEFAKFILEEGIESMSLNPNVVIKTIMQLAKLKEE